MLGRDNGMSRLRQSGRARERQQILDEAGSPHWRVAATRIYFRRRLDCTEIPGQPLPFFGCNLRHQLFILFRRPRRQLVRDPPVAIDTRLSRIQRFLVRPRRPRLLKGIVHILELVAIPTFLAVGGFHAPPFVLRQLDALVFKLLSCGDAAPEVMPKLVGGANFPDNFVTPFLGHMAVGTGSTHT